MHKYTESRANSNVKMEKMPSREGLKLFSENDIDGMLTNLQNL